MKVFLTGATGLIGAHTALALLEAGHDPRLLVRNRKLAEQYFARHGYTGLDFFEGDMGDKPAVEKALQGCEAVFHAAAMVSLDPKKAKQIYEGNINSIDSVIGAAHKLGINNIVYVSSISAIFNPGSPKLTEQSPLSNPKEAYSKSKRDCEVYVRKLQEKGVPVQITYPSGVFSPDDPKLNESNHALLSLLQVVPQTSSGTQCVDARDLAQIHVKMLESPPTGEISQYRFITAGNYYSWHEFHALMQNVTGRKIFAPATPGWALRFIGSIMDQVKKIYPVDTPITSESMTIVSQWAEADSSKVIETFGASFRPGEDTFTDTIRWLYEAGHLKKKLAGKLAQPKQ